MTAKEDVVVVAVDGSDAAQAAVRWAATTAAQRGVPLRLAASYHVPQALYAQEMRPAQDFLDSFRIVATQALDKAHTIAQESAAGLEISHVIIEGRAAEVLLEISQNVTMIVMGSRGLGGLPAMVLGSVSAAVVSHAFCPVVIVRANNELTREAGYGPVVVGADGSRSSRRAMQYAFVEAAARGCELIAVRTWLDLPVQSSLGDLAPAQEVWEQVEREQVRLLSEHLQPLIERYPAVPVTKVITRDRPARALVKQAAGAQLLVVGSHGRGGFTGMLLGSTSRALLQIAPCPLMVVRPESS